MKNKLNREEARKVAEVMLAYAGGTPFGIKED